MANHIALGALGEARAASYLQSLGYEILERNWRYGHLEIDLICRQGEYIIFVEIKTRRSGKFGGAAEAVTLQKQKKLIRAASAWLSLTAHWHLSCRFDVVCLTGRPDNFRMEHYANAFDYSEALDCGDAHWQYR